MKIRDSHATLNGDKTEHVMPSGGLDVISDDGKALVIIIETELGIQVRVVGNIKHNGKVLDDQMRIAPKASNVVEIFRPECERFNP